MERTTLGPRGGSSGGGGSEPPVSGSTSDTSTTTSSVSAPTTSSGSLTLPGELAKHSDSNMGGHRGGLVHHVSHYHPAHKGAIAHEDVGGRDGAHVPDGTLVTGHNGELSAAQRKKLPKKDFALGAGRYPIPNKSHARNALARVSQYGTSSEKAKVRAAVHRKFPDIGKE